MLSRDLSDLVIELSIALHKHAMYPDGHPSLETSRDRVLRRLASLLAERDTLSLGVAREQLIIEGVATDPNHPLLRGLARQLHAHDAGALKFLNGVGREELDALLRLLARDPKPGEASAAPGGHSEAPSWPHVRLFAISYDQLELVDGDGEGDGDTTGAGDAPSRERTARLWLDLAQAALQAETAGPPSDTDPELVAEAINTHAREQAYDQVIIGYLLKIAGELATGDRAESATLRRRVSRLITALDPEQLRRLIALGGDVAQRRRFLLDASAGLAVDAALTLVQSAADATQRVISTSLLRLFTKLAAHAERGEASVRAEAEGALREQIRQLVSGWALPDPTPGGYAVVLDHLAPSASLFVNADGDSHACEPLRLVQMSLEVDAVGPDVLAAIDALAASSGMGTLLQLLEQADESSVAARAISDRVATPEQLRRLLETPAADAAHLEWLVRQLGQRAADPLLDVLGTSASRATRRRTLGLLELLGPLVVPPALARLPDAPWFFQRNLLILIDRVGAWPSGVPLAAYAAHADGRVRREAVRILLKQPGRREADVLAALRDPDGDVVRIALGAVLDRCPAAAAPVIARRVGARNLEPDVELLAIRALSSSDTPDALACLLGCATASSGWFGGRRLAHRSPRLLAALTALATRWPDDHRVGVVLARAARHSDVQVRAAVSAWPGAAR